MKEEYLFHNLKLTANVAMATTTQCSPAREVSATKVELKAAED
jgi:hypothetical protein